jgi:hypothetical protein
MLGVPQEEAEGKMKIIQVSNFSVFLTMRIQFVRPAGKVAGPADQRRMPT